MRTRKFRHNDGHIKRKKSVCQRMCLSERHIKKSRVNDMLRTFNTAVLFAVQHFPNIRSNDIWNNMKTYYIQCFLNSILIKRNPKIE